MPLSTDERELLRLVAQSPAPVALSSFFEVLNPAPDGMREGSPEHEAFLERQIALFEVSTSLHEQQFVRVVHPADGTRPDLVEVTEEGLAALTATV